MEEKLGQFLFSDNALVYAILDGASVPDLPMRLFEMCPPNVCLYRGDLNPDLEEVAPYLVHLVPGTRFTNWLLSECWGRHWGIFAQSPYSLIELRKHFRKFLTVHGEDGTPMLFRYYDPRVLPKFLPTCQPEEMDLIFSDKVRAYFAESDDAGELIRLQYINNELKQWRFEMKPAAAVEMQPHAFQPSRFAESNHA
jgi:hypothetical protein